MFAVHVPIRDDAGITVPLWAVTALVAIILSLATGAFVEQRTRLVSLENIERVQDQRIDRLEGVDQMSVRDRAELRDELAILRQRQDRVIAAMATIKPELAGAILRENR